MVGSGLGIVMSHMPNKGVETESWEYLLFVFFMMISKHLERK